MGYATFQSLECDCSRWRSITSYRDWIGQGFNFLDAPPNQTAVIGTFRFRSYTETGIWRDPFSTQVTLNGVRTFSADRATWGAVSSTGIFLSNTSPNGEASFPPYSISSQIREGVGDWVIRKVAGVWSIDSFTPAEKYTITIITSSGPPLSFTRVYSEQMTYSELREVVQGDLSLVTQDPIPPGVLHVGTGRGGAKITYDYTPANNQISGLVFPVTRVAFSQFSLGAYGCMRRSTIWQCGNHALRDTRQELQSNTLVDINTCSNFYVCGGLGCDSYFKDVEPPDLSEPIGHKFTFGFNSTSQRYVTFLANQSCPP